MSQKIEYLEDKTKRIISFIVKILLNRRKEAILYYVCFVVIGALLISYIVRSLKYLVPLGYDGITYGWPAGVIISNTPWREVPIALISSFLGEDHLAPVQYIFGWLCSLVSNNPALIFNVANKLLFAFLIIISLLVAHRLLKDKEKVLLFFLFFALNVSMYWRDLAEPIIIPVITPLISLFFLNEYIEKKKIFNLLGFSFFYFLLTFSHETAFIGIPLLGIYCLFTAARLDVSVKEKIKIVFSIYLLMVLLFIPYALIHRNLYGTFIPSSRAALFVQDGNYLFLYLKVIARLFAEWFYGLNFVHLVPASQYIMLSIVSLVLTILGIITIVKFRIFGMVHKALLAGFLLQIACIIYTARVAYGMWLLPGIILWLLIADVLVNLMKKANMDKGYFHILFYGFIAGWVIVFAWSNETSGIIHKAESMFHKPYLSSIAAYRAIAEKGDRVVAVRLPGAEELMHPIAFWIGNKIYNGDPGLFLYPDSLIYMMKNMNTETYDNIKNLPFEYYSRFLIPGQGEKEIILLKDKNLFTRVYLDAERRNIIRAAVIPGAGDDELFLRLPDLSGYYFNYSFLEISLTFTGNPLRAIKRIRYGGSEIKKWRMNDGKIIFQAGYVSSDSCLRIDYNRQEAGLELIEVRFPSEAKYSNKNNLINKVTRPAITLTTGNKSCRYSVALSDGAQIAGTLEANKSIDFKTLAAKPVTLEHFNFELRRNLRDKKTVDLAGGKDFVGEIKLCQ